MVPKRCRINDEVNNESERDVAQQKLIIFEIMQLLDVEFKKKIKGQCYISSSITSSNNVKIIFIPNSNRKKSTVIA
jgi:hypothetical protein